MTPEEELQQLRREKSQWQEQLAQRDEQIAQMQHELKRLGEQGQEAWWTERSCRKHLDAVADARSGDASHGRAVPALPAGFARGGKCASGTSPGDRSASQAAGDHRTSGRVQSLSRVPAGDAGRLSAGGASAGAVWSGVWGD